VESGGQLQTVVDSRRQLQTVADGYLSSVSPRHSYCNWASPIIVPPPLAKGPKQFNLVKTYNLSRLIYLHRVIV